MKTISLFILFVSTRILFAQSSNNQQFVNPFIGTGGHGHTFPGATVPFGMVQLSPDTRTEGWDACGGYHLLGTKAQAVKGGFLQIKSL